MAKKKKAVLSVFNTQKLSEKYYSKAMDEIERDKNLPYMENRNLEKSYWISMLPIIAVVIIIVIVYLIFFA